MFTPLKESDLKSNPTEKKSALTFIELSHSPKSIVDFNENDIKETPINHNHKVTSKNKRSKGSNY